MYVGRWNLMCWFAFLQIAPERIYNSMELASFHQKILFYLEMKYTSR
jgi:hypothetical protein